jgi:hypothetical protein
VPHRAARCIYYVLDGNCTYIIVKESGPDEVLHPEEMVVAQSGEQT